MTEVTTMNWYEAGPMISYIEGDIDVVKAHELLMADDEVQDIIKDAIESEYINDASEIIVSRMCIGPMEEEFDGDTPMHLDDEGNRFWQECEPSREGSMIVTGISWEDWFVG